MSDLESRGCTQDGSEIPLMRGAVLFDPRTLTTSLYRARVTMTIMAAFQEFDTLSELILDSRESFDRSSNFDQFALISGSRARIPC